MTTKERKDNRYKLNEDLRQEFTAPIDNSCTQEEQEKYDILKELRIRLGKSKEEFKKIFDLYNNLLSQKNS